MSGKDPGCDGGSAVGLVMPGLRPQEPGIVKLSLNSGRSKRVEGLDRWDRARITKGVVVTSERAAERKGMLHDGGFKSNPDDAFILAGTSVRIGPFMRNDRPI